jgi:hypothetical protein
MGIHSFTPPTRLSTSFNQTLSTPKGIPLYTLAKTANSTIHREISNNTTKLSLTPTPIQTRETLSTILLEIPTTKNKKHKHNTENITTYIPKTNKPSTKTITKTIKNNNSS